MATGRLKGKAVIITGGGSGIGRAICVLFAREGASIAILDINKDGMNETLQSMSNNHGNKHCMIHCDITKVKQVEDAIVRSEQQLNQSCTILVHCAGILSGADFTEITEEAFDTVVNVNLKGTFLMNKEFLKSLLKNKLPGSIVNIASLAAKVPVAEFAHYCASKAGVVQLSKTIAVEYGKHSIRCNAILPGILETPMTAHLKQEFKEGFISMTPLKRIGKPEDVANACLFLASDESSFITGVALEVTGGMDQSH